MECDLDAGHTYTVLASCILCDIVVQLAEIVYYGIVLLRCPVAPAAAGVCMAELA